MHSFDFVDFYADFLPVEIKERRTTLPLAVCAIAWRPEYERDTEMIFSRCTDSAPLTK